MSLLNTGRRSRMARPTAPMPRGESSRAEDLTRVTSSALSPAQATGVTSCVTGSNVPIQANRELAFLDRDAARLP